MSDTKDKCHSYNGDFGTLPEVEMKMLAGILPNGKRVYKMIAIDNCIAPVIRHLWDNEIATVSSCCGHGNRPPSIVFAQGVENYSKIRKLIKEKDSRWFELSQWRRVLV